MVKKKQTSVAILGSQVSILDFTDVFDHMCRWIEQRDGQCHRITVTGFHGLWQAYKDREFHEVVNSADLWIPDGIAPVWVARAKGINGVRRMPGAELMQRFLHLANQRGYRSFFYGDTEDTLLQLKDRLENLYPNHKVAGTYSPPFRRLSPEEDEGVIRRINDARPDVLWVGLGLPKQDHWIYEHKDRLNVPVAVGVGAAFSFLAGKVKRVPKAVGDAGFEWVWRFVMEPKKLWRRDIIDGPQFVFHVMMELLGLRKYGSDAKRDLLGGR
jgi:N-acetylglucosaminyldiphosphoundecaprenol N-acetyl-beta-D-mannosaminyltransferase